MQKESLNELQYIYVHQKSKIFLFFPLGFIEIGGTHTYTGLDVTKKLPKTPQTTKPTLDHLLQQALWND